MLEQLLGGDLHEFVARVLLEHLEQRLAVVRVRREPRPVQHVLEPAAQNRDLLRALPVRERRVDAQEAPLAQQLAAFVDALDRDVVEVGGTVHGRAVARLGEHERAGDRADAARPRVVDVRELARVGEAQQAERRPGHRSEPALVALAGALELLVGEEGEVVLVQPAQVRLVLGDLRRVGVRRRLRRQSVGDLVQPRPHRRPVLDGHAHLGQHALDRVAQLGQPLGLALAVDLGVHHRLAPRVRGRVAGSEDLGQPAVRVAPHREHRVDQQVQPDAQPRQRHRQRIHEERHVVRHQLDRRVRRLPAVLVEVGVVDADPRLAGHALLRQPPMRHHGPAEVQRARAVEVLGRHPAVVLAHEAVRLSRLVRGDVLTDPLGDRLDQRGVGVERRHRPARRARRGRGSASAMHGCSRRGRAFVNSGPRRARRAWRGGSGG